MRPPCPSVYQSAPVLPSPFATPAMLKVDRDAEVGTMTEAQKSWVFVNGFVPYHNADPPTVLKVSGYERFQNAANVACNAKSVIERAFGEFYNLNDDETVRMDACSIKTRHIKFEFPALAATASEFVEMAKRMQMPPTKPDVIDYYVVTRHGSSANIKCKMLANNTVMHANYHLFFHSLREAFFVKDQVRDFCTKNNVQIRSEENHFINLGHVKFCFPILAMEHEAYKSTVSRLHPTKVDYESIKNKMLICPTGSTKAEIFDLLFFRTDVKEREKTLEKYKVVCSGCSNESQLFTSHVVCQECKVTLCDDCMFPHEYQPPKRKLEDDNGSDAQKRQKL